MLAAAIALLVLTCIGGGAATSQTQFANTTMYATVGSYGAQAFLRLTGNVGSNATWQVTKLKYNISLLGYPTAVAVYDGYIYVADYSDIFVEQHSIYRMRDDDGATEPILFVENVYNIGGMVVEPYLDMLIWSESSYNKGCGCVRAVDLSTGGNLRVLYRPTTEYWKGTQVSLDTSLHIMFVSWHVLQYNSTTAKLLSFIPPNTVDGGITMADADIGTAIDPVRRVWYGVTHNYGAISGNLISQSYSLTGAPITLVYHRDYSSIGTLAIDTTTQTLFAMIDYGPGLIRMALNGSSPTLVSSRIPLATPDNFLVWLALPTIKPSADCKSSCNSNYDCVGNPNSNCTSCVEGMCVEPNTCKGACVYDSDCWFSGECPNCLSGVCRPQPSCNMECNTDHDCSTLQSSCPLCIPDREGVKRCLAYPPSDFRPGVYLRTECYNNNMTAESNCSAIVYNLTTGIGSAAPIPIKSFRTGYANTVDQETSRYFVWIPRNTSLQNVVYSLVTYSYKNLDMQLVNECTVSFGAMTYDDLVSVGNTIAYDPATHNVYVFGGETCAACGACRAIPVDPTTCKYDNNSGFPINQHCPTNIYWPMTRIYPKTERFCSLSYTSPRPLCSFQCNEMTGAHRPFVYFPDSMNVCGSSYNFQYDEHTNVLYIYSTGISYRGLYMVNLTIPQGDLVHPVAIWPGVPYFDNYQFFLNSQPSPTWDPTGFKLMFYLYGSTPYVLSTNNTLVFRGPRLNNFNDGIGIYDDSFNW